MPLVTVVPLSKNCGVFFHFYCVKALAKYCLQCCQIEGRSTTKHETIWGVGVTAEGRNERWKNEMTDEEDKAALWVRWLDLWGVWNKKVICNVMQKLM